MHNLFKRKTLVLNKIVSNVLERIPWSHFRVAQLDYIEIKRFID